ncbi:ferredoxin reductase domain-containing protein [Tautonia plasticadhaerens]|uniref:Ferredoxin--NADP reductase n=1 Tax=Tautonia plasticadhaerens TaxID=2527974 RepID=A0A518H321_9BACT|nr:ferredoxin--NADP(+) reductase [Tautonia plasticadhaerens]QDV35233.1 Ferredoxin--NADP reductase [Tautonia plasticadhaerens]
MPPIVPDAPRDAPGPRYSPDRPGAARVASNDRITPEGVTELRHVTLDVSGLDYPYREGQSLGILIPGVEDRGHASTMRFYSIASGREGEGGVPGRLAFCVKRAASPDPTTGEIRPSPASDFLCGLRPGDEVALTGPFGSSFLMPDDPRSNLILVGTGTGVSPFRGFLQHAFCGRDDWTGQVRLFAGCRSAAECPYRGEFESYRDRPNYRSSFALSREQESPEGHRLYVHHRMEEQIEDLWTLLDLDRTKLYLCGIRGMEDHVERVLRRRAERDGISWPDFRRVLLDSGRLLIETY